MEAVSTQVKRCSSALMLIVGRNNPGRKWSLFESAVDETTACLALNICVVVACFQEGIVDARLIVDYEAVNECREMMPKN
jgi:hypothetical protein